MINDRQFFLTRQHVSAFCDWTRISLKNGYTVYCHPDLNIVYQSDRFVLLGYCWQVDDHQSSPEQQLAALLQQKYIDKEDIYSIEKSWSGRYLLIVDNWIFLDTLGSLGLFYSQDTLSSSLNVLCTIEHRVLTLPTIEHGKAPDFCPGMGTPYEGVFRLLPSQVYDYVNQKWSFRPLLPSGVLKFATEEECIDRFSTYFSQSLRQMALSIDTKNICLALTGGYDSRVTMAALEHAGIDYQAFTLWHDNIKAPDAVLPHVLAQRLHRKYRFIQRNRKNYSAERYSSYLAHTAGMAVDEDWNFYAYGQYEALKQDSSPVILLRSGGWEIIREYYRWSNGDINRIYPGITIDELFNKSVQDWNDAISQDQLNQELSYITRVYWDMRSGCWLSSVEQSFDMMDGVISIQPFNCRLFISILLSVDEKRRICQTVQNSLVKRLCPALLEVPYQGEAVSSWLRAKYYLFNLSTRIQKFF